MQSFDFKPSIRVVFGEGKIDLLGDLAKDLNGSFALLVSDPGVGGGADKAINSLKEAKLDVVVFDDVFPNPTDEHVQYGAAFAQQYKDLNLIVGLGGGSALDCAKGINFLLTNGGVMEDYWGFGKATKPMLPSIGIPTTAGTGSEAQSYALIAQHGTHLKMACGDEKARFRTVILDPSLTETVPEKVGAAAGIDAISHAVESYVTTKRNYISQMLAKKAWYLLSKNFEFSLREGTSMELRGEMLLGAHLAGMAIESSMLGAAHACANPLTSRYGVTHGVAVGLMLPHVIDFNSHVVEKLYHELLITSGSHVLKGGKTEESLVKQIKNLRTAANLPDKLRDCQIDRRDLPQLAKEASGQWTGKFNPRPISETELLKLYEQAY